jgi:hypothetical protein
MADHLEVIPETSLEVVEEDLHLSAVGAAVGTEVQQSHRIGSRPAPPKQQRQQGRREGADTGHLHKVVGVKEIQRDHAPYPKLGLRPPRGEAPFVAD